MIRKKDEEKILSDLKKMAKDQLEAGFKNRKGKPVDSVESLQIINLEIDKENQDRDKVIVLNVQAIARVWVIFHTDSKSNDDIHLRNSKPIEFYYDKEIDNFKISDENNIFFDNSTY